MPVLFENIPANIRVPFFYAEFRPGGTPYTSHARLLLIGQKLDGGSAVANRLLLGRDNAMEHLLGRGSMLLDMYRKARINAPVQEIWLLPLDDLPAGVAATGLINVYTDGAGFSRSTTVSLYIAGRRVRFPVLAGDSYTTIASNLVEAINSDDTLPVTASTTGILVGDDIPVVITARHKGTLGNFLEIDLGEYHDNTAETRSVINIFRASPGAYVMTGGQGDPDLGPALAELGDDEYDWIASPYADSESLQQVGDLLGDVSGRWSWASQKYGHYLSVHNGTVGALSSLGGGLNDQHVSIFPCRRFQSAPWEVAGALGGRVAAMLQSPPNLSRPLQTVSLIGIEGPRASGAILTMTDRQTLYYDGISGYHVRRDGTVCIDRLVTTYQSNLWGDQDATYLDVETMAQTMFGIRYLRQKATSTHGRQALADLNPGRLPHITTPENVRNTLIHGYHELVRLGVFENADLFARDVRVERDPLDANRINASLPLDHVNQLRILAVSAVNHLQRRGPGADILNAA